MSRLPARVDWIVHKRTGAKVALRLNKKTMEFQAEYGGQIYGSKDGAEVRAQVLAAIEKSHQLVFQPIIQVQVARGSLGSMYFSRADFGAGLALAITRFYISREDELRMLTWEDYKRNNVASLKRWMPSGFEGKPGEFTLPFSRPNRLSYGSEHYYLPYSEQAWEGLQRIVKLVETARGRLDAFLGDPGVVAKLISIGTGSPYPLLQAEPDERSKEQ